MLRSQVGVSKTRAFALVFLIVSSVGAFSQAFKIIHNFSNSDGAYSFYDDLTQGFDGNLWGTTFAQGVYDDGTAYRITPGGSISILNNFSPQYAQPEGALVLAPSGIYYGVTPAGGTSTTVPFSAWIRRERLPCCTALQVRTAIFQRHRSHLDPMAVFMELPYLAEVASMELFSKLRPPGSLQPYTASNRIGTTAMNLKVRLC